MIFTTDVFIISKLSLYSEQERDQEIWAVLVETLNVTLEQSVERTS